MNLSVLERQALIVDKLVNQVPNLNPFLFGTDSYKVSHIDFEQKGVKEIYSNMTPRFDKYIEQLLGSIYDKKYVVFGVQWMVLRLHTMAKTGFFDRPKDEVIAEMKGVHGAYIGNQKFDHFEALHDLGYLPVIIKSLDEGTIAPVGTPFLTIRNTLPEFEWLPNYLETLISTDLWKEITVATVARCMRLITNKFALETTGSLDGTEWQNHDFHVRGGSGFESSAINGAAWLTSSCGTDNIPALWACNNFYQSSVNDGLLAGSVSAGEHSVTTLGILTEVEKAKRNGETIDNIEGEYRYKKMLLTERFPTGIFSDVVDSFDFWAFVTQTVPRLKDEIMARDGKYVVRGDSGNPVDIICGTFIVDNDKVFENEADAISEIEDNAWDEFNDYLTDDGYVDKIKYSALIGGKSAIIEVTAKIGRERGGYTDNNYYHVEEINTPTVKYIELTSQQKGTIECLWEIFGGTVNDYGYKVLDSHIGMIYGDGINAERSQEILSRLKAKGFASTNIVFGVGSYLLNLLGRDHLGMAIKATNSIVEIDGELVDQPIYKDPKTDRTKKSARGLISVHRGEDGEIYFKDMQTRKQEETGLLSVVYMNGQFHKLTNIFEIRDKIWK